MVHSPVTPSITATQRILKAVRTLFAISALASTLAAQATPRTEPKPDWSTQDMPSQNGRIVLVTGGTSGMGYEDALALTRAGAEVIIAARNAERGCEAIANIKQAVPEARVQFETLDLANLQSVRDLANRLQGRLPRDRKSVV